MTSEVCTNASMLGVHFVGIVTGMLTMWLVWRIG